MKRLRKHELMNIAIRRMKYKSYLGIGIAPKNFSWIKCEHKDGVDPNGHGNYKMTSDEFFARHPDKKYDIIFIDGDHHCEQVMKDVTNSMNCLKKRGVIFLHDVDPKTEVSQSNVQCQGHWHGTVWKAIAAMRMTLGNWWIGSIDLEPFAMSAMARGINKRIEKTDKLDWPYFQAHRDEILNFVTADELISRLENQ